VQVESRLVDLWVVSHLMVENTERLPARRPPAAVYDRYGTAKMVASLDFDYARRLRLNIVAGWARGRSKRTHPLDPRNERHERAVEYTVIVKGFLAGEIRFPSQGGTKECACCCLRRAS
jgi:hypothetical protein